MINNVFNTHNVLVGRQTPSSLQEWSFTKKGQEDLSEAFVEFLEEHFEPEDREAADNSKTFKQFMKETFYPDEITSEFEVEVYQDTVNGFGRKEVNPDLVEWKIDVYER
jgi:hypothetical protein